MRRKTRPVKKRQVFVAERMRGLGLEVRTGVVGTGVINLPLAFWMYGRIGAVTTLYRS